MKVFHIRPIDLATFVSLNVAHRMCRSEDFSIGISLPVLLGEFVEQRLCLVD